MMIHFMGTCMYTLTKSTIMGDPCAFNVEVKNEHRKGKTHVAYSRMAFVEILNKRIEILPSRAVKIDGVRIYLPYSKGGISLGISGRHVQLTTECNVKVQWDGRSNIKVTVPKVYDSQMTGLCGDCNGKQDDYQTKEGKDVSGEKNKFVLIGNSYTVADVSDDPAKVCKPDNDQFEKCNKDNLPLASQYCGILKALDGPFGKVLQMKDEQFQLLADETFDSCLIDVCANVKNPKEAACSSIEAFATYLEDSNFIVDWRTQDLCPLTCDENMVPSIAAEACPENCVEDTNMPDYMCEMPVTEGCVCREGFVLSDTQCVKREDCGCSHKGQYYKIDDEHVSDDCKDVYRCQRNETSTMNIVAQLDGCSKDAECVINDGLRQCVCNPGYGGNGKYCTKIPPPYVCPSGAMEETVNCEKGTCAIGDGHTKVLNVAPVMESGKEECYKTEWFEVSRSSITILQPGCDSEFVVCYQQTSFVCPIGLMSETITCEKGNCLVSDGYVKLIDAYAVITGEKKSCFESTWYQLEANSITITQPGCGSVFQVCYEQKIEVKLSTIQPIECSSTQVIGCSGKIGEKVYCPMKGKGRILKVDIPDSWSRSDSSKPCDKSMVDFNDKGIWLSDDCLAADAEACIGKAVCRSPCGSNAECEDGNCKCKEGMQGDPYKECFKMCSCRAYGTLHYRQFDGENLDFGGACTYVLSQLEDQTKQCSYIVEVTNKELQGQKKGVVTNSVTVQIYGQKIDLFKKQKVKVDNQSVTLPYRTPSGKIDIVKRGSTVNVIASECNIIVSYNGRRNTVVRVPKTKADTATGICGNCNSERNDDYIVQNSVEIPSGDPNRATTFITEYLVKDSGDNLNNAKCLKPVQQPICPSGIQMILKRLACNMVDVSSLRSLATSPFSTCMKFNAAEATAISNACLNDACMLFKDIKKLKSAACAVYENYAALCREEYGISVTGWRFRTNCRIKCGDNMEYTDSATGCQPTCGPPPPAEMCTLPYEGCVCKMGYLLSGDKCVKESECGCVTPLGKHMQIGDQLTEDCDGSYECIDDNGIPSVKYIRKGSGCFENAKCVKVEGNFKCRCNEGFNGDGITSCDELLPVVNEEEEGLLEPTVGPLAIPVDDINECSTGQHTCSQFADCINEVPEFSGTCKNWGKTTHIS
ncbi:zonadhesin-like [Mizuhopecten yessoensis]|uniref:Zonadhesin n=1 Tax=Mizuhopecten yessoensis TaxID=6573 RepID=A0A210QH66_MIZYE|nr:zonadhesin-like [Mizuhopecten yessoensis]OWF48082.1 Zonadhesin [Mizuhopecten yessoensis]